MTKEEVNANPSQPESFTFQIVQPFSSPQHSGTRFVIEGLFKEGGLSSLVAKPKQGKSSLSRYAAVCVAKGQPFLGRKTQRGEVLLISIEDPITHVDNCLRALQYDPQTDEPIHLVESVSSSFDKNIAALRGALISRPNVRLVVIDTLAKLVRIKDVCSYNDWLPIFGPFRELVKDFSQVNILSLVHAKKIICDDPFDAMLGSSALRAEFDTNAAIYQEGAKRLFLTESRIGRRIEPTALLAGLTEYEDSEVVTHFALGQSHSEWKPNIGAMSDAKRKQSIEDRVIEYLSDCPDETSVYGVLIENLKGKTERKIEAIQSLINNGVLTATGTKGSSRDSYAVTLNRDQLELYGFQRQFGETPNTDERWAA